MQNCSRLDSMIAVITLFRCASWVALILWRLPRGWDTRTAASWLERFMGIYPADFTVHFVSQRHLWKYDLWWTLFMQATNTQRKLYEWVFQLRVQHPLVPQLSVYPNGWNKLAWLHAPLGAGARRDGLRLLTSPVGNTSPRRRLMNSSDALQQVNFSRSTKSPTGTKVRDKMFGETHKKKSCEAQSGIQRNGTKIFKNRRTGLLRRRTGHF